MTDDDSTVSADEDPYADTNVEELPDWWQRNVELFREHKLRPYRPPVFKDEELLPPVVDRLEAELEIDITIVKPAGTESEAQWQFLADGEAVISTHRTRTEAGRSVYGVSADAFEAAVRRSLSD